MNNIFQHEIEYWTLKTGLLIFAYDESSVKFRLKNIISKEYWLNHLIWQIHKKKTEIYSVKSLWAPTTFEKLKTKISYWEIAGCVNVFDLNVDLSLPLLLLLFIRVFFFYFQFNWNSRIVFFYFFFWICDCFYSILIYFHNMSIWHIRWTVNFFFFI